MKKTILILLILMTTAQNAFGFNLFNKLKDFFTVKIHNETEIPDETEALDEMTIPDGLKFPAETKIPADIVKAPDELKAPEEVKLPEKEKTPEIVKKNTLQDKISQINSIKNDEQKVKEWAKFNNEEYYVIINKKDCSAVVYNKKGSEISRFEVGIGKEKGDDFNDTSGVLGKSKNTTPAGEYTLIKNIYNKSAYGDLTLSLGSKALKPKGSRKMVGMHKVPKFRSERLDKFYDGNLANNRMSHGCINFLEEDFEELTKYIHAGLKVYVLPEEEDNYLMLTKNDKNEFELIQTKY